MTPKEQKIKEAFGESWKLLSHSMQQHILTVHHWVDRSRNRMNLSPEDLGFDEVTECEVHCEFWRPIQLKGIENNNGWIKIESEEDMPKSAGRYYVKDMFRDDPCISVFEEALRERWLDIITHYQPIEKPKPPIY
ncbi:hypothetical protein [Chryseobacterium vrystaatense]|uniref:Uncharacterized protein n=1 Tax=Chryseobacterium vrystaatense TaxID=307480 RepID=A0A1M4ZHG1_9FLAO|nr:hypothetical protein [Chryseobacterium vrystaatense]SHF17441.1 hypothetical protein SAMN02787073_1598 [Chryseobacterium vrystaatense]